MYADTSMIDRSIVHRRDQGEGAKETGGWNDARWNGER